MRGKQRHDFDVSFRKSVNALFKGKYTANERNEVVEEMTEGYFAKTGEYPSGKILEKMANFILDDDLRDDSMDKVTKTEYPILSEGQFKRRRLGRRSRKMFATTEVDLIEDEVNYHANTLLNVFLVYRSPGKKFRKSKLRYISEIVYFDRTPKKYGSRSEGNSVWSKAVKERDEYMCQNPNCASRVGIMHAHHINSYVDNPEVRTDLANGITLCSDCHSDFHSSYGKGGNNRKQLEEFFGIELAV